MHVEGNCEKQDELQKFFDGHNIPSFWDAGEIYVLPILLKYGDYKYVAIATPELMDNIYWETDADTFEEQCNADVMFQPPLGDFSMVPHK